MRPEIFNVQRSSLPTRVGNVLFGTPTSYEVRGWETSNAYRAALEATRLSDYQITEAVEVIYSPGITDTDPHGLLESINATLKAGTAELLTAAPQLPTFEIAPAPSSTNTSLHP